MNKLHYGTTYWQQCNQAVSNHENSRLFSILFITIALMVKHTFPMPLRSLQGLISFIFTLA
ncbi:Mobile element protein [Candidatus Enterovibrio altilux]|uniref:Mobile element protein n=1 Tax=Candidatus Enterovibrio altilux TaxID=1927128 RepID=A0A291B6S7_9GAMM|nr:Mobile element protein [Candidatus Enterovibrio luxaltus]